MAIPQKIVTRFAPSPTGFLHIGGARTALFNWAFARRAGGSFLLRIEDTDRKRSTAEAIAAILDGLAWLGLQWDGEEIYQHENAVRHVEVAEKLLASGHAYKCYCTPAELDAMREKARAEGRPPRYDGTCREKSPQKSDAPFAVRFKAPQEGDIIIDDKIQGKVTFAADQMDDLILLRSDGTPTYMLSVVVDDHDMGITHIIRGDDHLTNAARQAQIFAALGWEIPVFAHLPLIHGADGAKLSKRHGALGVDAYCAMGYLPEAMCNYLARLGWSHGNEEIFSTDKLVEWFNLESINRSPARFDQAKLDYINSDYIRKYDDLELAKRIMAIQPTLAQAGGEKWDGVPNSLFYAMPLLKPRAKTLHDLADGAAFLVDPITLDAKAQKALTDMARGHLADLLPILEAVEAWNSAEIEGAIRGFIAENGLKLGDIAPALRAALTGGKSAISIFDTVNVDVLGKEKVLARIRAQIKN